MTKTTHLYNFKFLCPKCGNNEYTMDKFQAAGNIWFRDIPNKKFTTITCSSCFYTEVYKVPMKKFAEMVHLIKT